MKFLRILVVIAVFSPLDAVGQARECPEYAIIPGGSNPEDRTRHRCNFEVQPDLSAHLDELPGPRFDRRGSLRIQVFVDSTGTVDSEFTRMWTRSGDSDFSTRFMDALHRVQLTGVEREGLRERFSFELIVEVDSRADTVPEAIDWTYSRGELSDTLKGTWIQLDPVAPYGPEEKRGVLERVARRLVSMGVLTAIRGRDYCVVLASPDSITTAALRSMVAPEQRWLRPQSEDCVLDVRQRRLIFAEPQRTGGGRTVVMVSGDHLESWPPGFDGRYFPGWTAYCALLDQGVPDVHCNVGPVYSGLERLDRPRRPQPTRSLATSDGPINLKLRVHGANQFVTDTISGSSDVAPTNVRELAQYDEGTDMCTSYSIAGANAEWIPNGHRLVRIELDPPLGDRDAAVSILRVTRPNPEGPAIRMRCGDRADQPFAITGLQGLGPPLDDEVEFCLETECDRSVIVQPHEPLQPVLSSSFGALRKETLETDGFLMFELVLDRSLDGLIPILLLGSGDELALSVLGEYDDGSYRWGINRTPRLPLDSKIELYLVQR